MSRNLVFIIFLFFTSCSNDNATSSTKGPLHQKGEFIHRRHNDPPLPVPPQKLAPLPQYPWRYGQSDEYCRITKEHFRCNGSSLNPLKTVKTGSSITKIEDCGGRTCHSLPLKDGKEFIYPILIDLLNDLQKKTGKRVVITCGHQCPKHYAYSKSEKQKLASKHMVGAEVDFYVSGLEDQPMKIVELIMEYFKTHPKYKEKKTFSEFTRYTKADLDVSTPPWMNQEILIKLYQAHEGRNFDNRHPYPYISLQVRYDFDDEKRVEFNWQDAEKNFLRW